MTRFTDFPLLLDQEQHASSNTTATSGLVKIEGEIAFEVSSEQLRNLLNRLVDMKA